MKRRTALSILAALCAPVAYAETAAGRERRRFIFQQRSLYRNVMVTEGDGRRCMTFGRYHGDQTCIALDDPARMVQSYTQGLMAALFLPRQVRRVLVIGLGGGVLPRTLRALYPEAEIDTVELDPAVAAVARSHFGFVPDPRSRVFIDDGRVFVRKQRRAGPRYDVVLIDAFEKDYIPEHMLTKEFLQEVRSVLAPGGMVGANTFTHTGLARYEAATYQAVFGAMYRVDLDSGNRILLVARDGLPPLAAVRANAARLAPALRPFAVDADDLLARMAPAPVERGVRVLTDQFAPANLLLRRPAG